METAPGWRQAGEPGNLRWWDGQRWTGFTVKRGVPTVDWATTEQPTLTWVLGFVFLLLGAVQTAIGSWGAITTYALGALWLAIAAQTGRVRRVPAPSSPPEVVEVVRPLPGEQEGPFAGWYVIAPQTSRWWTGARWSQYTYSRYGIRPTFHGPRSFRRYRVLSWSILALGAGTAVAGVVCLVVGADAPSSSPLTVIGVFLLLGGVLLAVVAAVLLGMSSTYRRVLLLPPGPPHGPPHG
ncbi:DUF2510 domain-containing protein [Oerskovia flava]|uniref:DUF2510 domain-containing protein n=1 Tax=Oerskovia flava TaxID=2986422 RepID=UPI00223FBFD6|nr:DUF2510 domain-containing protein [Oerskovia sp. JB1-3-2]